VSHGPIGNEQIKRVKCIFRKNKSIKGNQRECSEMNIVCPFVPHVFYRENILVSFVNILRKIKPFPFINGHMDRQDEHEALYSRPLFRDCETSDS